jgi:hypothetical protein
MALFTPPSLGQIFIGRSFFTGCNLAVSEKVEHIIGGLDFAAVKLPIEFSSQVWAAHTARAVGAVLA